MYVVFHICTALQELLCLQILGTPWAFSLCAAQSRSCPEGSSPFRSSELLFNFLRGKQLCSSRLFSWELPAALLDNSRATQVACNLQYQVGAACRLLLPWAGWGLPGQHSAGRLALVKVTSPLNLQQSLGQVNVFGTDRDYCRLA